MKLVIERLKVELDELLDKLNRLDDFIEFKMNEIIDNQEMKDLLIEQSEIMHQYASVLEKRIDILSL